MASKLSKNSLIILFCIFFVYPFGVFAQSSYSDSDAPLILPRAVWESAPSVDGLLDWMPEDKGAQTFQDDNPNSNGAIPDYAPVERIVIHDTGCSLSSARCNSDTQDSIGIIQSIYRDHAKKRGWGDIGYHYIVDRKGNIYEGRFGGNGVRGAHVYDSKNCRNFNVGTVGIVVLGNYMNSQPPQAAMTALAKLTGWLSAANGLDPDEMNKTLPVWANPKINGANGGKCDTHYGGLTQNFTGPVVVGHDNLELNNSDPGILDMAKLRVQAKIWKEKYADYLYQAKNDKIVAAISGGVVKKIADDITVLGAPDQARVKKINDNQMALFPEANQAMLSDGTLIKSRTRNDIYILENGKRRHISSARLFKKSGYSLADVKVLSDRELLGYAKGDAVVYPDGSLLASEKDGKVYLIKDAKKRYVVSPTAFKSNKLKEKDIIKIPEIDLEQYPDDGVIGNLPEGTLISISSKVSAPNYVVMDGGKKLIPSWDMFSRWKFSRSKIKTVSKKEFDIYPDKGELLLPDGVLVYEEGRSERYLTLKGKIHWVGNYEVFSALGLGKQKALALTAKDIIKYQSSRMISTADDWRAFSGGKQPAIVLAPPPSSRQSPVSVSTSTASFITSVGMIKIGLFSPASGEAVSVMASSPFTVKQSKTGEQKTYSSGETATINWGSAGDTTFTAQDVGTIFTISSHHAYNWNKSVDFNVFRGNLSLVYSQKSKKIWMVNALPFEEYLQGLGEALNTDPPEYRKAFAVASRSYALFHLANGGKYGADEVYHLNNTSSDQVYKGYAWEQYAPNLVSATKETQGEAMKYKGKVARSVYSSDSGGITKNACALWGGEFCGADYGYLSGGVNDPDGTARRDTASQKASHGVGMSATGARHLAELGKTYKEILAYYYKDIVVEKVY